ncbi:MAG: amidohydrolase family protein, partial [Chloroflexota bacterium]|nr:amidohydrolase family protein [Chloroflexota bacterium]
PIHWYAGKYRTNITEAYFRELDDILEWAKRHPGIPCVLTHGLNQISTLRGQPGRYDISRSTIDLLKLPNWHVELMLHIMSSDYEFPPYNPKVHEVVRELVEEVGAESLVWGSDMPACERTCTYKQSLILFQTQCDFLSDRERAAILGGNLERLYPAD